ncbi:hypothetical protein [Mongoliitalea lutea]|nr:hypothetical protein [Mongoliitalea lutea]
MLKEKEAQNFVEMAEKAITKSATVDFSNELKRARAILKKAKMM